MSDAFGAIYSMLDVATIALSRTRTAIIARSAMVHIALNNLFQLLSLPYIALNGSCRPLKLLIAILKFRLIIPRF